MKFTSATALSILISSTIAIPTPRRTQKNTLVARQKNFNWIQSANDGQSANTDMLFATFPVPNCQGNAHETVTHVEYGPYHAYPSNATKGSIQSLFLSRRLQNDEQLDFFASSGTDANPLPAHNDAVPPECQYFLYSLPIATPNGCWNIGEVSPCWRLWLNPAYCSGGPDC
ncbi:hypothetical protein N7G274_000353 [Stereocaulon virgatum]|uniref:Uncharacterized protein n=1 Tax=Stereocaulon virgatum TaxID=373712 RepID=A0ABR4AUG1_9LECA